MEETEKMTALKKAYAEIILNTAKEAAARIIVSERRAQSFQRDLSVTKDEALQILLRSKQMIDCKMDEAATKNLIQQKRIDELEAQLHEAEDVVGHLRAELCETQTKLERLSRNHNPSQIPEETNRPEAVEKQQNNLRNHGTSVATPKTEHESACYEEHCDPGHVSKTDVTSLIIRSKGPEQYRNGCTQRIRACDRNLLNGHHSLSEEPDVLKCEKGGNNIGVSVPASGIAQDEGKNLVHIIERMNDSKAFLRLKRKRALRQKRNSRTRLEAEKTLTKPASETPEVSLSVITETDNDSKGLEGRLARTIPSKPPSVATSETESISVAVTDNDLEIADALVLITQENGSKTDMGLPGSEEEQEKPSSPAEKSNAQVSDSNHAISIQSPKDRIVKYTFQRKRKRESIGNDDTNSSPPKDILKQKTRKVQDDVTSESSRDSRRMAQVARQLISLSEKTWRK